MVESRSVRAQPVDSGSNGSDGVLDFTGQSGTVVFNPASFNPPKDPDGDHIFHFMTITIPAGVTVRLSAQQINAPVFWLASGAVQIDGVIDLNGEDGHDAAAIQVPSSPGSGGFGGGVGGPPPQLGNGPGGATIPGGSAGYVTVANGQVYGNDFLLPLIGGSGGAGGNAGADSAGGGAGGGALLIASSVSITVNGT